MTPCKWAKFTWSNLQCHDGLRTYLYGDTAFAVDCDVYSEVTRVFVLARRSIEEAIV